MARQAPPSEAPAGVLAASSGAAAPPTVAASPGFSGAAAATAAGVVMSTAGGATATSSVGLTMTVPVPVPVAPLPGSAAPGAPVRKQAVKPLPFQWSIVAGAAAGGTELMILYPLDVVKTRFQIGVGSANKTSMVQTLANMVRSEGPLSLYRGILPPMLVEPLKRSVKFASNSKYQELVMGHDKPTYLTSGVCGALAGVTEAVTIAPFELVKVRLQAKELKSLYKNSWHCAQHIFEKEGVAGFTRGLETAMWRNGVWNGVYFSTIFVVKDVLPKSESSGGEMVRNFGAGLIGGVAAVTFNTPFDVVASRMRAVVPPKTLPYSWAWTGLVGIARTEGVAALWKGFVPKLWRLGPGGGILLVAFEKFSELLRPFA